jgi:hypothetical protein
MSAAANGFDSVNLGNLAHLPVWVGWQKELRKDTDEPTKVPYVGVGRRAMANGTTWLCRNEAEKLEKLLPKPYGVGGIGIEFVPINNQFRVGGIDFDLCRNSETGQIENWAQTIIDDFATYAEVSPSGTGVKIFFTYSAEDLPRVDGGLNPRINGAGQNIGTEFAVIPPEQKDWTVSPLSTPLAARGGGRRPAFTGG